MYYILQKSICCCQQNLIYSKTCVAWLYLNVSDSYFVWAVCKFARLQCLVLISYTSKLFKCGVH